MKAILTIVLLMTGLAGAQSDYIGTAIAVNVPTTASLRGLSVVSREVVWASGTEGTVIRTVDGGKSWSVMQVPGAEALDFRGIKAFDDKTAVIISSGPAEKGQAKIYRTTDGGATWNQVFEERHAGIFFDAVAFWDREHGMVLSDPVDAKFRLFITSDGGSTWSQLQPSALPAALSNEGAFAASNSCLTVQGKTKVWFATGGASVARVFRSGDRGRHWSVDETPMHPQNASSGIFSLSFYDRNHGIAVGGDYQHPEASNLPTVLRSGDGGASWQTGEPTQPGGIYLSSVVPLQGTWKKKFAAVGITGMFVHPVSGWNGKVKDNLNSVGLAVQGNIQELWAVGPKGKIIRYPMFLRVFRK